MFIHERKQIINTDEKITCQCLKTNDNTIKNGLAALEIFSIRA